MKTYTRREFFQTAAGAVAAATLSGTSNAAEKAKQDERFNILFLMTDQHNHGVLGCAGNPVVKTPNLDNLASQGARFTQALCSTPFCTPTRGSLVTGLWPHTHGFVTNVRGNSSALNDDFTVTENILFDRGYKAVHLGKWHLGRTKDLRCYAEQGDRFARRKLYNRFVQKAEREKPLKEKPHEGKGMARNVFMTESMTKAHEIWRDEKRRSPQDLSIIGRFRLPPELCFESWLADYCIGLLEKYAKTNFVITYSVSPPHAFWTVPDPFYSMYDPAEIPVSRNFNHRPPEYAQSQPARLGKLLGNETIREYLRCYYGQVTMMDWCMGRILDALKRLGLEENTLVIFTSDHGDMQGGHGMVGKSVPAYYEEIVRVPLIIRYPPSIRPGALLDIQANSVDIMPTLLDYAGVEIPKNVQGRSLRPFIEGKTTDHGPGFCERGRGDNSRRDSRMIRTTEWKYAVFGNRRRELFNLVDDPAELKDLADDAAHHTVRDLLHDRLRGWMRERKDPALHTLPKV